MESKPVANCVASRIAETAKMPESPAVILIACIAILLPKRSVFIP